MAKPDMPYGLFPWNVPPAPTPSGALAVDLATVFKWYWRVRSWTVFFTGRFSVSFAMSDSTTINLAFGLSALETFDVLIAPLDELSLCLGTVPPFPGQYLWALRGSPIVSGSVRITDPDDPHSPEIYSGIYQPADGDATSSRGMFAPGRSMPPYSDGFAHMTRDPSSGLFTPFLGAYPGPIWNGATWALLYGGEGFGGNCIISSTPQFPDSTGFYDYTSSAPITVAGSVDGHSFAPQGFVQWYGGGVTSEAGSRSIESTTYAGDGAISLTITPFEYWAYAPRIDPNPTYDSVTGAIAPNPATGAPWTIQEIISRQGP